MYECAVCRSKGEMKDDIRRGDVVIFDCPRCGRYSASGTAWAMLPRQSWTPRQIANASGWIREHQRTQLSSHEVDFLSQVRSPGVGERAAKVLLEIARRWPAIGETFDMDFDERLGLDWLGISWSVEHREVEYLFLRVLHDRGLIAGQVIDAVGATFLSDGHISPSGHERLEEWKATSGNGAIGFCAMWFSADMLPAWTGAISPAIQAAGYQPERIDNLQHNNKIDDEIIAMIRKSRFVVADFTGNRGGVYFEAGFAMGLGIPVIWTIRKDHLDEVHFDNRQYNFVVWDGADLAAFEKGLRNRIEATIGRGPLVPT